MAFRDIKSFRNRVDFWVRSHWRMGRKVTPKQITEKHRKFQGEIHEFLSGLDLPLDFDTKNIRVADIGCRDFATGPVIEKLLQDQGYEPEVHGIELDAYRRFVDLRTRADYCDYFATSLKAWPFSPK